MTQKNSKFLTYKHPEQWTDRYDSTAKALVTKIIDYMNQHKVSQAWLCKTCILKSSTLSQTLNGKYISSPHKMLEKIWTACQNRTESKKIHNVGFVHTSLYKLILSVCKRTRMYRNFGVIPGYSGVGKTRSIEEYVASTPNTILVKPNPAMSQGALLDILVAETGAVAKNTRQYKKGSREERFIAVCDVLKGSSYLIILDEANTVSAATLETLRRIRDLAEIGIVLVGTEYLNVLIKPEHGQFDQLRNRVSFWPKTIESITRDDADAVASAGFSDLDELSEEVLDRLWDYHQGNMRVLTEMLIPAIRDYGLTQGNEMSVNLIDSIAAQALSLKPAARKRGAA